MIQLLLGLVVALLIACIALLVVLLRRQRPDGGGRVEERLARLAEGQDRAERVVRDEVARIRLGADEEGHRLRSEVSGGMTAIQGAVLQQIGVLTTAQGEQLGQVMQALQGMTEGSQASARELRGEVGTALKGMGDSLMLTVSEMAAAQKREIESFSAQVAALSASSGEQMERLRGTVEGRLDQVRTENAEKLEQVRATVDEKLQGVLEQRLGESFRAVSERLEQVHRGLGEMQTLATGVGDLKRVLSNVKVRGTWGEVQLGKLLEQILTEGQQFEANVATNEFNGARVEYAIKLPGDGIGHVWLPIDAKFPVEDYQRLMDAQDAGDLEAMEAAARGMESRVRSCAKDICLKYLNPPQTTDFAIMFLPTEGLYAEVLRRPGLVEAMQREWRVVVAGPTTILALLNSLQMGFRTLAITKRSSEAWEVLGAVKTEFGKFGEVLVKVRKKLNAVTREIDQTGVRTRAIQRKLKQVEELPAPDAARVLQIEGLVVSAAAEDASVEAEDAA
jgi:DNA recombination protein RmuC